MYCFGCGYELTALVEERCPECGRAFDASDPSTFASSINMAGRDRRAKRIEIGLIAVALVPLIANAFAYTALMIARISMGRWPYRYGRDDPSDIAGAGLFGLCAILLVIATLPALIAGLLFAITLMTHEAWTRLVRSGILGGALWSFGFALTRWDPAEVWIWLWD
jgi:rRNA maturation protein Nop10